MPSYELATILQIMKRPELHAALKRTAKTILEKGGILRKLENLGVKELPYKVSIHGKKHQKGNYFLFHFDSPPTIIPDLMDHCHRDVDVVRPTIVKLQKLPEIPCALDEELLPPAYRKDVQNLMVEGKQNKKILFKPYELVIETKPY